MRSSCRRARRFRSMEHVSAVTVRARALSNMTLQPSVVLHRFAQAADRS